MGTIYLSKITFEINNNKIATNKSIMARGLCSVSISSDSGNIKEFPLFFGKTHMYSSNNIKIEGTVKFNGKIIPASKLHFLLNQHVIYSGRETVVDSLYLINPEETNSLIKQIGISFAEKKLSQLSPEESRIFEIAVNLASKPQIIYIKRMEMKDSLRVKVLDLLKKHIELYDAVVLVETDFTDQFDSAVVIKNNSLLSFNKRNAERFFNAHNVSAFDFEESPSITYNDINYSDSDEVYQTIGNTDENYDYKESYKKYSTESIIDLKQTNISIFKRIFNLGIYRIDFIEAIKQGLRRYDIVYRRKEPKTAIFKSLRPCFYSIVLLRLLQICNDKSVVDYLPDLLCYAIYVFFNPQFFLTLIIFFCKNFIIKKFSFLRIWQLVIHFCRSELSNNSLRLVLSFVCFSIFYNYSSILDEESQLINYNMNILISPGTFIMSIFVYIFFTHFLTFITIGFLFNIKHMTITVISASFTNIFIGLFIGKRLRVSIIGLFMTTFLLMSLANMINYDVVMVNYFYILFFPCSALEPSLVEGLYEVGFKGVPPVSYFYIYCFFAYMFGCMCLSFK